MEKSYNNLFMKMAILIPLVAILGFAALFMLISGTGKPNIECFAVDSSGRVYVGKMGVIEVHENGQLINTFSPKTSKGYCFTILRDDTILLSTAPTAYSMTLDGSIIKSWDDNGTILFNELQRSRYYFESADGAEYRVTEHLWRSKIVKNSSEIVYEISDIDFLTRILLYCFIISFISVMSYIFYCAVEIKMNKTQDTRQGTVPRHKTGDKTGDGSLS